MALAHHDAAHGNQRSRREAPLLGTKHTGNSDVPSSTKLTISLDGDTAAKVIQNKGLVSFSEAELPRKTGVLNTCPSRGTSTAVVA